MVKRWLTSREIPFQEASILDESHMELARTYGVASAPMVISSQSADSFILPITNPDPQAEIPSDAIVFSGYRPDVLTSLFPDASYPEPIRDEEVAA